MSPSRKKEARRWSIHSTRLQLILYSMLLVATPFVLLRSFLQEAIGEISRFPVSLAGREIPLVPSLALLLLLAGLVALRRKITRRRILAGAVAIFLIWLAQRVADYYFQHRFYYLQQNWHYFAYGIFAFMARRDCRAHGMNRARTILFTFTAALLFSTFDETVQKFISSRVFDIGDIAKDGWGVIIGMTMIALGEEGEDSFLSSWRPLRRRRLGDYLNHAPSLLLLAAAFTWILLCFGSILTDARYLGVALLWTLGGFLIFFALFHLSQFRVPRWGMIAVAAILVLAGAFAWLRSGDEPFRQGGRPGLVFYRGLPILYFDVMVHPDGGFRLVDKKQYFTTRDRKCLLGQHPDVIVVASGVEGSGGRGFPETGMHQFNWNLELKRGTQVLILPNAQAAPVYNRLKAEGKHVLLVCHNGR